MSIAPLGQLRRLRSLGLNGPVRHPETTAVLTEIEELSLRSVTLPDLASLRPMRNLRSLWIGLGGTADLRLLPELAPIETLELWRIRGLRDVDVLARLPAVRSVHLQSMSAVATLPSLRGATSLRTLTLDTMEGITDLAPIADAPVLEELNLIDMPQLEAEALRPLLGHPTLRRGRWGLGSTRKNVAAFELLPLGEPPYGYSAESS